MGLTRPPLPADRHRHRRRAARLAGCPAPLPRARRRRRQAGQGPRPGPLALAVLWRSTSPGPRSSRWPRTCWPASASWPCPPARCGTRHRSCCATGSSTYPPDSPAGNANAGAGITLAGASAALVWPPYIAAVETHLTAARRSRAHGLINSGTAYGVAVAGPLSLVAGSSWRTAWIVFAVLAVVVTTWCAIVLGPHRPPSEVDDRNSRLWPVARRPGTGLLTTATLLGLVGGCYWTFGVEAATAAAPASSSSGAVFQLVVGLSGITGGAIGSLVARATLPHLLALTALGIGAACLLLTIGPPWLVLLSAALYGAAFIASIGLLVIWNTHVVPEAAATGVATSMFAMGTGLIIGPPLAGTAADTWGIDAVFLACIPLSAAVAVLARDPRSDIGLRTESRSCKQTATDLTEVAG